MTEDKEYLELWKYFQERADNIKDAMVSTLTWTIGFAAALLGFIFAKLTDFDSAKAVISLSSLVRMSAILGLGICLYSYFILRDSRKHIKNNWGRAERCKEHLNDINKNNLNKIIEGNRNKTIERNKQKRIVEIWDRLLVIILFFVIAFIIALIWTPMLS